MKTLFASISENVQFVLLCLAVTAAVVLLAWGGERLVMKKRHRLNTARGRPFDIKGNRDICTY